MENLFSLAERCLQTADINEKLRITHHAYALNEKAELSYESPEDVSPIVDTVFPERPILLEPRDMPRRRLGSPEGKAAFFHALAHIEFIAIYLAWDIVYRFRDLPQAFYRDWLQVADEEALHFAMLREHLQALGLDYGDLPAHRGLWDHAEDTADDLLARLAIVPRYMEARGLDVTPAMIDKLRDLGDSTGVALLTRILEDEVGHVQKGSYWFKYFCEQQGLEPENTYRDLLTKYFKGKPKGPFNREMRIIAGFSHVELDWLERRANE